MLISFLLIWRNKWFVEHILVIFDWFARFSWYIAFLTNSRLLWSLIFWIKRKCYDSFVHVVFICQQSSLIIDEFNNVSNQCRFSKICKQILSNCFRIENNRHFLDFFYKNVYVFIKNIFFCVLHEIFNDSWFFM